MALDSFNRICIYRGCCFAWLGLDMERYENCFLPCVLDMWVRLLCGSILSGSACSVWSAGDRDLQGGQSSCLLWLQVYGGQSSMCYSICSVLQLLLLAFTFSFSVTHVWFRPSYEYVCSISTECVINSLQVPLKHGRMLLCVLLAAVKVFTVHSCVSFRCSEKTQCTSWQSTAEQDIFFWVCGWLLCGCWRQTDRRRRRRKGEKSDQCIHLLLWAFSSSFCSSFLKTSAFAHLWQRYPSSLVTICVLVFSVCVCFNVSVSLFVCMCLWIFTVSVFHVTRVSKELT